MLLGTKTTFANFWRFSGIFWSIYPKKGHFEARQGRPDPRADIFYTRIRGHFGPKFGILDRTFEGIVRGPSEA